MRGFICPAGHVSHSSSTTNGWSCPDCGAPVKHSIHVPGGELEAYAWPGGYPLIYLDSHGEILCAKCAEVDRDDPDTKPLQGHGVHWEGPSERCAECNAEIPSAYGDPDATEGEGDDGKIYGT